MTALTEARHSAEFIISEANGHRSRENGTGGATLPAGEVVKVSSSKLVSYNGSGTVAGILITATELDQPVAYIARDAEVNFNLCTSSEATDEALDSGAITGLALLGIIVRD
jgi:hypothetical protein